MVSIYLLELMLHCGVSCTLIYLHGRTARFSACYPLGVDSATPVDAAAGCRRHQVKYACNLLSVNGLCSIAGKQSPNPFVVPRFIGAVQRNPAKDRMNAVTTNGS